jgi:ubiquinone/menaquinone biosynthesis C-methylase UbiE
MTCDGHVGTGVTLRSQKHLHLHWVFVMKSFGTRNAPFFGSLEQEMPERVCPWWLGYLLASPLRKWISDSPERLLESYTKKGMTVVEPGPGMGFFTLPLARMVGPAGRIIAIDIQPRMLESLRRRAGKAGLTDRIETHLVPPDRMNLPGLASVADLVLAFAVVHEMPSAESFFSEAAQMLKPGGLLYFAEPRDHVKPEIFAAEIEAARAAGLKFKEVTRPHARRCHSVILEKA